MRGVFRSVPEEGNTNGRERRWFLAAQHRREPMHTMRCLHRHLQAAGTHRRQESREGDNSVVMEISTSKRDVIWNYVGTFVSMTSGFILLPLLLAFLTEDELGLWYVFLAISNLTQLFEWGFEPTFARNIVFVLSGGRKLTREGRDASNVAPGVDWHLLRVVFSASKMVFGVVAVASAILECTLGTAYVAYIASSVEGCAHWISWAIFCLAIFLNLYFLYCVTFLRGTGDVAGENRAKTFARLMQIAVSALLLFAGMGLVGAAIGFLVNGLMMRVLAFRYLKQNKEIRQVLSRRGGIELSEIWQVFRTISFVALRSTVVQFASYAATQASTILCSLFLSLGATGLFSVAMQFANAVCNFAGAYIRSYLPSLQAAFSIADLTRARRVTSRGLTAYWLLVVAGSIAVPVIVFPLVHIIRPDKALDVSLFFGLTVYLALWNHCSLMNNIMLSANFIPFTKSYVVSAVAGIAIASALTALTDFGAWGIVIGLLLAQSAYNNWHWPHWVMRYLGTTYKAILADGFGWMKSKLEVVLLGARHGKLG